MTDAEAQVLQRETVFIETWKAADAAGLATMFAEDAVRVSAFGEVSKGRAEIKASFDKLFKGPMQGAKLEVTSTARELAPGLVVVNSPIAIHPPGGAPMKGHAVEIWSKKGSAWLIVESHPKFFPPRP
jgi:uncharacterized protein (TIGR02246 family)